MRNAIERILTDENFKNALVKNASTFVMKFYQSEVEKVIFDFFKQF